MELAAAERRIRQLETELAVSRKVDEVFLKQNLPQSLFPVIASLARAGFDVQRACVMLGVSASGYYDWKCIPPSARALRNAWLAGEIAQVHEDSAGDLRDAARHRRAPLWPRDPRRQGPSCLASSRFMQVRCGPR